jgi:hypothetical protein
MNYQTSCRRNLKTMVRENTNRRLSSLMGADPGNFLTSCGTYQPSMGSIISLILKLMQNVEIEIF